MSINAMADAAISRRPDYPPFNEQPKTIAERAQAAGNESTPDNSLTTAIKTLTTYIPTETLTLYVAFIAVIQPSNGNLSSTLTIRWVAFFLFLIFTPFAVWITYATKMVSDKKMIPLNPGYWPWWEMTAGTIAYISWAYGLPSSVFAQFAWYSAPLAGFFVLVTSTLLGMLAGLFQQPLKATGNSAAQ